jgi:RNA 2',3'-cyclic 3'-phosphodiesterase
VRLFIAIAIPDDVRKALADLLQELRAIEPSAKWVRAENLHVTLKFLGHTEPEKLRAIEQALKAIRSPQPVALQFRGLGFFPNEKRPRVFWTGMAASANLRSLAEDIDHAATGLGFPAENRPFAPHLTLARFDPAGLPARLGAAIEQRAAVSFGSLSTSMFHLIESKLKPTGAEYTTVQSFPFVTET